MRNALKALIKKYFDYDIIGEYYDTDSNGEFHKKYIKKYYLRSRKMKRR